MTSDEILFFESFPQMLPVYQKLRDQLKEQYPDLDIGVQRTQISLRNRHVFAVVSLPRRRVKGRPEQYLLISFGLSYRKESGRIEEAVEPYPNRWTHHVVVERPEEIDEELLEWLDEAYSFSIIK